MQCTFTYISIFVLCGSVTVKSLVVDDNLIFHDRNCSNSKGLSVNIATAGLNLENIKNITQCYIIILTCSGVNFP